MNKAQEKFQNDKFLLILLLITQSLKEKSTISANVTDKEAIIYKACQYFLFTFSLESNHIFLGIKI
jgi:hypothetical protein